MAFTEFPTSGTVYEIWAQNGPTLVMAQQIVADDDAVALAQAEYMVQLGEYSPYAGGAICHVENGVRIVDVQPVDPAGP